MVLRSFEHAEAVFHDRWAEQIDVEKVPVKESFQAPTAFENKYILFRLGNLRGKKVLDVGCGAGEASIYLALRGARVTALDISPGMIKKVNELAQQYKVDINTVVSRAESMPFCNLSFDVVYGNSVLHHCDIEATLQETKRVLKPGGVAVFIEPLTHNPVINVYRRMARPYRTEGERPLRWNQLKIFKKYFEHVEHCEFWLTAQVLFLWFYVVDGVHPAEDRYWKRIITQGYRFKTAAEALGKLDKLLLKMIPLLRPLCWNTVIICTRL